MKEEWRWGLTLKIPCMAWTSILTVSARRQHPKLHVQEATVLSRAVKEHERRRGQKEGFSGAPGDCLAFKYYRDVSLPQIPRAPAEGRVLCRAAVGSNA